MSEDRAVNAAQSSDGLATRPLAPPPPSPPAARDPLAWFRWLVTDAPYAHVVVPVVTFLLIAACAVWLWHWQSARELADVRDDTELIAPAAADRFEVIVKDELRPLGRFARELGSGAIQTGQRFEESVAAVRLVVPSLKTVAWVDQSGIVVAVSPTGHANELAVGRPVIDEHPWSAAYMKALRSGRRNAVVAGHYDGKSAQWVCLPYLGHEGVVVNGRRPQGVVVARVSFGERAETEFAISAWTSFHLSVRDAEDNVVYA